MTESTTSYDAFRAALTSEGLNIFGVLTGDRYDAVCPPPYRRAALAPAARSAIIIASGGRDLWTAIARSPEGADEHPINTFTPRVIREAVTAHLAPAGGPCLFMGPNDMRDEAFIPIQPLAVASGVGVPSRMMLLLNPDYGLWIGLRGVVLTPLELPPTAPLADGGFDPCANDCDHECMTTCHGQVISPETYDSAGCVQTRLTEPACATTCDARRACPVGSAHAYTDEQMAHHAKHLLNPELLARFTAYAERRGYKKPE